MAEAEKQTHRIRQQTPIPSSEAGEKESAAPAAGQDCAAMELFLSGLSSLTPKEQALYECYTAGMTTDIIMEKLAIKENTLKFHSKNLYSKLGVKSRKQLVEFHKNLPPK